MGLRAAHPRQPRSSTSRIQSRMRPRVVVSVTLSVIVSVINELDELSHSEGATRRGPQRLHKAISLRVRLDRSKYGRCGWDLFLKCMQLDAIARLVVLIRWLEDRRKHLMREAIRCNHKVLQSEMQSGRSSVLTHLMRETIRCNYKVLQSEMQSGRSSVLTHLMRETIRCNYKVLQSEGQSPLQPDGRSEVQSEGNHRCNQMGDQRCSRRAIKGAIRGGQQRVPAQAQPRTTRPSLCRMLMRETIRGAIR